MQLPSNWRLRLRSADEPLFMFEILELCAATRKRFAHKNSTLTGWVVFKHTKYSIPQTLIKSARLKAVRI